MSDEEEKPRFVGDGLSFFERVRIASHAAAHVRKDTGRRVKVVAKDGSVKEALLRDVQLQMLARAEIELSVEPEKELENQKICPGYDEPCPKSAKVPMASLKPMNIAARGGFWHCRSCIMKKAASSMTPEQRTELARRRIGALTKEQRSEAARKGHSSMIPEKKGELARMARKAFASMTPEQRSERSRKANLARAARKKAEGDDSRRSLKEVKAHLPREGKR